MRLLDPNSLWIWLGQAEFGAALADQAGVLAALEGFPGGGEIFGVVGVVAIDASGGCFGVDCFVAGDWWVVGW